MDNPYNETCDDCKTPGHEYTVDGRCFGCTKAYIAKLEADNARLAAVVEALEPYRKAVEEANRSGVHAVPVKHSGRYYWELRTPKGYDFDLGWLIKHRPTHSGWPSWADAINATRKAAEAAQHKE